jgi:hypothetical protein
MVDDCSDQKLEMCDKFLIFELLTLLFQVKLGEIVFLSNLAD